MSMASQGHVVLLRASVNEWNDWRSKNPSIVPDLSGAELGELNLAGAHLHRANLAGAHLTGTRLVGANLTRASLFRADCGEANFSRAFLARANLSQAELIKADLRGADLSVSYLVRSNLSGANLSGANLRSANLGQASLFRAVLFRASLNQASLFKADLSEADLSEASLEGASLQSATLEKANLHKAGIFNANLCSALLVGANLENAVLDNCSVYGVSVCAANVKGTRQNDLDIMPVDEPVVTVDDLGAAEMLGLLVHQEKLQSKVHALELNAVLIIGGFPPDRKPVLEAVKRALREREYIPIVMDFQVPGARNLTETIKILGRASRFVIADTTGDAGVSEVLDSIVHYLPSVPIQPIIGHDHYSPDVARHFRKFSWVLPTYHFGDLEDLARNLGGSVIGPAEAKAAEFRKP